MLFCGKIQCQRQSKDRINNLGCHHESSNVLKFALNVLNNIYEIRCACV